MGQAKGNGGTAVQTMMPASALGPSQAGLILGVTGARVVQLAEEGRLPCLVTPLGRIFDAEDVERLARERRSRKVVSA
jgi:predicted site-specific integrase-resolvase